MAKKPTKYAHITPKLPKWLGNDPNRRAVVDSTKAEIVAPPKADDPPPTKPDDILAAIEVLIKQLATCELRATAGKRYASEFARLWLEQRRIREKITEWDSSFSVLLEAYLALAIEQFEVEGITRVTLEGGQPIYSESAPHAVVEDKEAYRLWCLAQGRETVAAKDDAELVSTIRQALERGESVTIPAQQISETKPVNVQIGTGMEREMHLQWGTTNSILKRLLVDGEREPDGVKAYGRYVLTL